LAARPLWPEIDFNVFGCAIITSENTLHSLKNSALDHNLPIYCVGERTAQAVTDLGFIHVEHGGGSVRALFERLCEVFQPSARLIYLRADVVSAPLAEWLTAAGFTVDEEIVYTTQIIAAPLTPEQWAQIDVIMLHSARAAQIIAKTHIEHLTRPVKVIALSQNVALAFVEALGPDVPKRPDVLFARKPDDAHMIALIA
jgi:uroporphyrinogen-III synthase